MTIHDSTVAEPTPTTPVVDTPATETPEPAVSIADHAEQFSPTREPANTGQFTAKAPDERHRAQSQRATPEEVAEINKLTKELRETEQRLADKDPDAKSSPRLRTLRRQIAALKALDAPVTTATDKPEPKPVPSVVAGEFTEKEPKFEDFSADPAKYPDPLEAWMRATARYETKKDRWEASQEQATHAQTAAQAAEVAGWNTKQATFAATKPDYATVAGEFFKRDIGPVMVRAIVTGDNGPAVVYHLAEHPELADELVLLTHGKPVEDAFVALVQRRLAKEVQAQAVSTGSAAPPRPYTPPRPPNPVRTGPIKTTDDPPAQASSIAEHARYHGPKR